MNNSELIKELEQVLEQELKRRKLHDAHYGTWRIAFKLVIHLLKKLLEKTHKNKNHDES